MKKYKEKAMGICQKVRIYFKMIKLRRIVNAVLIFKREGIAGIRYHFSLVEDKEKGRTKKYGKEYDITPVKKVSENISYKPIRFEKIENPLVSIIIPVYNYFDYTYHCLEYIKKYAGNIPYEIIVGDDCSTDLTCKLEEIVEGIQVIHNDKNYQFLMNCNRISAMAKGKYLLLLNNDTQVQKGWLKELVNLLERDERIGLAGSKLIYPSGLVQEAGGIVWKDATVLQFGNDRQPEEEELNFEREADYISGASVIIRRDLWDQIGGFDIRYAPAYYEDVDLAFQVRERGYKVVYQPKSEVIHFEGVTESIDEQRQNKIEQNRKKFLLKWGKILESRHYEAKQYRKLVKDRRLLQAKK